jgi:hypothetical protein
MFDEVNVKPIALPAQWENPADGANATVIELGVLMVSVKRGYLLHVTQT